MTPIIELQDVSYQYHEGPLALEKVTLAVESGEFLGIVGPNGSGKSTLLKIILGLLQPTAGQVRVFGKTPVDARRDLGYVPQFAAFPRNFPITVEKTVLMGRLGKTRSIGGYSAHDKEVVERKLDDLGILELKKKTLQTLSGGQLQRVLIARALAAEPELLLLDEPTSSIDPHAEENIFDFLKKINDTVTILVVSHDIAFISHYIKRVACVNKTLVCHSTRDVSSETIHELYAGMVRMIHHDKLNGDEDSERCR